MKKLLTLIVTTAFLFTQIASAYTLTNTDKNIAQAFSDRITQIEQQEWSTKKQVIIQFIQRLQDNTKSERNRAIFGEIVRISTGQEPTQQNTTTQPTQDTQSSQTDQTREDILRAVNAERAKVGAPALTLNEKLNTTAQKHAEYMSQTDDFAHTTKDWKTMVDRIEAEGYQRRGAAENIARNQTTVDEVMTSRMNSAWHRKNILNPDLKELWVGYAWAYRVQVFWSPK